MRLLARLLIGLLLLAGFLSPAEARLRLHQPRHAAPAPAAGEGPSFLGAFRDWSAYTRGEGGMRVCYALSEPKSKEPARAKRDPVYFLLNDWPSRRSKAEAEVVPGYQYRDGSTVTVQVGATRFVFFTKNQGSAGGAWVLNPSDEPKLLATMRNGTDLVVTGTSKRGTLTRDTYSLGGMGDALDKIHDACGM